MPLKARIEQFLANDTIENQVKPQRKSPNANETATKSLPVIFVQIMIRVVSSKQIHMFKQLISLFACWKIRCLLLLFDEFFRYSQDKYYIFIRYKIRLAYKECAK